MKELENRRTFLESIFLPEEDRKEETTRSLQTFSKKENEDLLKIAEKYSRGGVEMRRRDVEKGWKRY